MEIPICDFGGGISVWGGASDSGTRRRQSTLALGYLVDREESEIVAPKWYVYEDLVGYVSIVAEEVQNLE